LKRIWIPQAIVCLVLLWALYPDNPYGYYVLLRWICCAVFAYLALKALAHKKEGWTWILGVTAAIYNPIIPLHITREIWSVINVITIGIAIASLFSLRSSKDKLSK